jgi:hypothetical protein
MTAMSRAQHSQEAGGCIGELLLDVLVSPPPEMVPPARPAPLRGGVRIRVGRPSWRRHRASVAAMEPPRSAAASDTDPHARAVHARLYRAMTAERKLELVVDAIRTNRELLWAGLAHRFPNESDARRERRLLGLVLGEELAARVWGPLDSP